MAIGKVNVGGGIKITGQGETTATYYEDINKGDLVTIRRYFGMDNPFKLANPSVLPPGTAYVSKWSRDDRYLVVTHNTTPYMTVYKRDGDNLIKLANPTTLPSGGGSAMDISHDGTYIAIQQGATGDIKIYKNTNDVIALLTTINSGNSVSIDDLSFSPDGNYLASVASTGTTLNIFTRSGDTFTKTSSGSGVKKVDFSPDGQYLAVGTSSEPYYHVYNFSNGVISGNFTTDSSAGINFIRGLSFSGDGVLAMTSLEPPYLFLFQQSGLSFTKKPNLASMPSSAIYGVDFSSDGKYLSTISTTSPYVKRWKKNGSTYDVLGDLSTPPTGVPKHIDSAYLNPYFVVAHETSPYISVYKSDILGDYAHLYNNISELYSGNYVAFGYAKSVGLANDTNKKVITLPIK